MEHLQINMKIHKSEYRIQKKNNILAPVFSCFGLPAPAMALG
jgi:hypothetical protein